MADLPAHTRFDVPEFETRHRMQLALERAGVSPHEMAGYLAVSRNTIGNWLAGRTRPPVSALRLWAQKCGVSYEWLAGPPGHEGGMTRPRRGFRTPGRLTTRRGVAAASGIAVFVLSAVAALAQS